MKEIKLDLKDRKILYELDVDARRSFSQIAKKVGLSKEVVNYRVKNMLRQGVIKNFFSIIDVAKLGYMSFRIFLKTQHITSKKEQEIINYLKKQSNVGWIVSVKGNWDINFVTWHKDAYKFNNFWKKLLEKYKNSLNKYQVSIITKLNHYRRAYTLDKKQDTSGFVTLGDPGKIKIDGTDLKILNVLAYNARMTSLEISEKIKTTEKIVRDRIKKLIKNKIILGFRALLDVELLGYEYYKIHLTLNNFNKENLQKLLSYSHHHPNIIYYTETIGGYDFELDIQIKNNKELYRLIKDIKNKFPNLIRDFEFMQYDQEYKLIYLPS